MPVVRKGAQIMHRDLDQPRDLGAAHDSVFEEPAKEFRKNGYKIEAHRRSYDSCRSRTSVRGSVI
jgi:hypothetical protein